MDAKALFKVPEVAGEALARVGEPGGRGKPLPCADKHRVSLVKHLGEGLFLL